MISVRRALAGQWERVRAVRADIRAPRAQTDQISVAVDALALTLQGTREEIASLGARRDEAATEPSPGTPTDAEEPPHGELSAPAERQGPDPSWDSSDLRSELGARLGVSPQVHPQDMIWNFIVSHEGFATPADAVRYYFEDGAASAARLVSVIERNLDLSGTAAPSLLEFASGYGCVSRHLGTALNGWKVTSCDIHSEAVDFLATELNMDVALSVEDPEQLALGEYDTVFALSFFSHMPARTWGRWLAALYRCVKPGGILVFTTHGMVSRDLLLGHLELVDGFGFEAISEQDDLDSETYGTTVTAPSFVIREIYRQLKAPIAEFAPGAWWSHQDLWVVSKPL